MAKEEKNLYPIVIGFIIGIVTFVVIGTGIAIISSTRAKIIDDDTQWLYGGNIGFGILLILFGVIFCGSAIGLIFDPKGGGPDEGPWGMIMIITIMAIIFSISIAATYYETSFRYSEKRINISGRVYGNSSTGKCVLLITNNRDENIVIIVPQFGALKEITIPSGESYKIKCAVHNTLKIYSGTCYFPLICREIRSMIPDYRD